MDLNTSVAFGLNGIERTKSLIRNPKKKGTESRWTRPFREAMFVVRVPRQKPGLRATSPSYRRFRLSPRFRSRWRRRRAFFSLRRFSSDGFMYAMFCRYSRRMRLRFTWRRKRLSARSMSSLFRTLTPTANVDPSLRSLVPECNLRGRAFRLAERGSSNEAVGGMFLSASPGPSTTASPR